jgi:hypothetical protein
MPSAARTSARSLFRSSSNRRERISTQLVVLKAMDKKWCRTLVPLLQRLAKVRVQYAKARLGFGNWKFVFRIIIFFIYPKMMEQVILND